VNVIVNKAGNDRFAAEIRDLGVRAFKIQDLLVGTDRSDAFTFYGDCLSNGKVLINRQDLTVYIFFHQLVLLSNKKFH